MRAGPLWRHFHRLFQLHHGAVVVVHGLHHLAGQLVRQHGIRIDRVHLRQSLLGELHVQLGQQIPEFLVLGLTRDELLKMGLGNFQLAQLRQIVHQVQLRVAVGRIGAQRRLQSRPRPWFLASDGRRMLPMDGKSRRLDSL